MLRKLKPKKCKVCGELFTPFNSMGKVCSVSCGALHAKKETQKRYRKEAREFKEIHKPKRSLLTEAQKAFNGYIRIRDHRKPCISCESWKEQTTLSWSQMQAGHWYSVGAHPELRFTTWNCRIQCTACNINLSGNPINYRLGLQKRFGS
jgi:hypothetical protein